VHNSLLVSIPRITGIGRSRKATASSSLPLLLLLHGTLQQSEGLRLGAASAVAAGRALLMALTLLTASSMKGKQLLRQRQLVALALVLLLLLLLRLVLLLLSEQELKSAKPAEASRGEQSQLGFDAQTCDRVLLLLTLLLLVLFLLELEQAL